MISWVNQSLNELSNSQVNPKIRVNEGLGIELHLVRRIIKDAKNIFRFLGKETWIEISISFSGSFSE